MSKEESPKDESKRNSSIFYALMAVFIILGVIIAGVVLYLQKPDEPDPVVPTPPVIIDPEIEYEVEGSYFFQLDESDISNIGTSSGAYAIINHWSDIEKYFKYNEDAIALAKEEIEETGYSETPSENDKKYLMIRAIRNDDDDEIVKVGITSFNGSSARVTIERIMGCSYSSRTAYEFWLIPIDDYDVKYAPITYENQNICMDGPVYEEKKPVIYLYPDEETDILVKLGNKEKLTVSYPAYNDGWRVKASEDGKLVDLDTGRELYSLYYETDYTSASGVREDGFVVKGSDTAKFLEEKLAKLGLTEREAEEFIIYWLPQMQNNAYNYIYFADIAEINENMPLDVSPAPATIIRVNMEWKALDAPIGVKEQKLPTTPERKGFTLVEWGGTILK